MIRGFGAKLQRLRRAHQLIPRPQDKGQLWRQQLNRLRSPQHLLDKEPSYPLQQNANGNGRKMTPQSRGAQSVREAGPRPPGSDDEQRLDRRGCRRRVSSAQLGRCGAAGILLLFLLHPALHRATRSQMSCTGPPLAPAAPGFPFW